MNQIQGTHAQNKEFQMKVWIEGEEADIDIDQVASNVKDNMSVITAFCLDDRKRKLIIGDSQGGLDFIWIFFFFLHSLPRISLCFRGD